MKKLLSIIAGLMLAIGTTNAQGWPENYGGVMLQTFVYEGDAYTQSSWKTLLAQCDNYSKYFDLLWVPPSGYASGMGYCPVYWLTQRSSFGSATDLRDMIAAYKAKGVGVIADVVVNHKAGKNSWVDFPNETKNNLPLLDGTTKSYSITWGSGSNEDCLKYICKGDECKDNGYTPTGAADTGENYEAARDLDHTNATVQDNIKQYLDYLVNYIGYTGFRYDYCKGYNGKYVGMYNQSAGVQFSVGEYWDGNSTIRSWMEATKNGGTAINSGAFDFQFKYRMNEAFGSNNLSQLNNHQALISDNFYSGGYKRYAITFCDNHDTGRDSNKLTQNWSAANAYMLAAPGTPCVWIKHYQADSLSIRQMILARKAAGLTNTGTQVLQSKYENSGFIYETKGTKGQIYVQFGNATTYGTPSGYKRIASGDDYIFYCSEGLNVDPAPEPEPTPVSESITINVNSTKVPYLYAWDAGGTALNGAWPGTKMTQTKTKNGKTWYYKTFTNQSSINIIFNDGGSNQTADITGITSDKYFTWNGTSGYTDVTTTGIDNPYIEVNADADKAAFNLAGQRVNAAQKGIVIVNGKKVVR